MSKALRCRACDTPANGRWRDGRWIPPANGRWRDGRWIPPGPPVYSRAECAALRSDALPYWLKPSDFAGEVRRALVRRTTRAWTVAESVALASEHCAKSAGYGPGAGQENQTSKEARRRLLQAIDKGPPTTPAAIRADLDYHLKRWESHDGLSKADRGSWEGTP